MENGNRTADRATRPVTLALIACTMLAGSAGAGEFPDLPVPPSDRILTAGEVKNFWVNAVRALPVPNEPSGLHPGAQARWRRNLERRLDFVEAVRAGAHDTRAELVRLEHNREAWRRRGDEAQAAAAANRMRDLREHLARLETLRSQRQAARAQVETARTLEAIEAELAALRASCPHSCCTH